RPSRRSRARRRRPAHARGGAWPLPASRHWPCDRDCRYARAQRGKRDRLFATRWQRSSRDRSYASFEWSRVPAAQHDIEAISQCPVRLRQREVELRYEAKARALVGNRLVHRVVRAERIAGEIHLRDEPRRHRVPEEREVNVRGTPGVVVVATRIGAWLDRQEPV